MTDSNAEGRCGWCGTTDPLYIAYHDTEWGVPERDPRALWEKLTLDGFQAGLAWITILRKREGIRDAFDGFDPEIVARYDEDDIQRLLNDPRIIRSRAKIKAAIRGAQIWQGRRLLRMAVVLRRRRTDPRVLRRLSPGADPDGGIGRHGQGAEEARLQLLRPRHRLCFHAGCRHGQ